MFLFWVIIARIEFNNKYLKVFQGKETTHGIRSKSITMDTSLLMLDDESSHDEPFDGLFQSEDDEDELMPEAGAPPPPTMFIPGQQPLASVHMEEVQPSKRPKEEEQPSKRQVEEEEETAKTKETLLAVVKGYWEKELSESSANVNPSWKYLSLSVQSESMDILARSRSGEFMVSLTAAVYYYDIRMMHLRSMYLGRDRCVLPRMLYL